MVESGQKAYKNRRYSADPAEEVKNREETVMKKLIVLLLALIILFPTVNAGDQIHVLGEDIAAEQKKDDRESVLLTWEMKKTVTLNVAGSKKGKTVPYSLTVGQILKLKTDAEKTVKWKSADESVVAVTGKDKATALKIGTVMLEGNDGSKKYKVKVTVNGVLSASTKKVSVKVGEEKKVRFTLNAPGAFLTYKIKNKKIVSAYWDPSWTHGNTIYLHLVGKKAGTTYVTVTNSYNNEKIKIKVTVKKASDSSKTKYRALLIGNSNYPRNPLPNHKTDVQAMKGLLTKSLTTKYTVTAKYDCSASSILSGIKSAFSGAKSNDVSLFYYGGHGLQYSGALCGVDGSYVYPNQLRDALLKVPGKVIVILECCHSGSMVSADSSDEKEADISAFNKAIVNALSNYTIPVVSESGSTPNDGELRESKFIVLTACQKYEESWNWWYYGSYADQSFGTFTKTMFNGLGCRWSSGIYSGSAPCDKNRDGIASLGECYTYIYNNASRLNQEMGGSNIQHCMYYGNKNYKLFTLKK